MPTQFEYNFTCAEEDIDNICTEIQADATASSGYVAVTSLSKGEYKEGLNCNYRLIGRNIRLQLITVNLTDIHDCLHISNSLT